jgi:hypothetical protein
MAGQNVVWEVVRSRRAKDLIEGVEYYVEKVRGVKMDVRLREKPREPLDVEDHDDRVSPGRTAICEWLN